MKILDALLCGCIVGVGCSCAHQGAPARSGVAGESPHGAALPSGDECPVAVEPATPSPDSPAVPTPAEWGSATGRMTRELVQKVVDEHRDELRACYENGLKTVPTLSGRVDLKWQVLADGTVGEILHQSTMRHPPTEECIVAAVRQWRFSSPSDGWVEVNYPFIFRTP